MSAPHLGLNGPGDVLAPEGTGFLAQNYLKGHVQHEVAQLLPDSIDVFGGQGVVEFERLLDQVGAQRQRGLGGIPGTPLSQVADQFDYASKR